MLSLRRIYNQAVAVSISLGFLFILFLPVKYFVFGPFIHLKNSRDVFSFGILGFSYLFSSMIVTTSLFKLMKTTQDKRVLGLVLLLKLSLIHLAWAVNYIFYHQKILSIISLCFLYWFSIVTIFWLLINYDQDCSIYKLQINVFASKNLLFLKLQNTAYIFCLISSMVAATILTFS